MANKIKINAPASNPHICYIPMEYKEKIEIIKRRKNLSFYRILCEYANIELNTKENIKKFKATCRKKGFKGISDWACHTIDEILEENV